MIKEGKNERNAATDTLEQRTVPATDVPETIDSEPHPLDGIPFWKPEHPYSRVVLTRYVQKSVPTWEDAEDIVAETERRGFENDIRGPKANNWLTTVAQRLAIDLLRRKARSRTYTVDPARQVYNTTAASIVYFGHESPPPDEIMQRNEERDGIHSVLQQLPKKYRDPLMLRDMEDLKPREIAKILNIDGGMVRWRINRARKLFRNLYMKAQDPSHQ